MQAHRGPGIEGPFPLVLRLSTVWRCRLTLPLAVWPCQVAGRCYLGTLQGGEWVGSSPPPALLCCLGASSWRLDVQLKKELLGFCVPDEPQQREEAPIQAWRRRGSSRGQLGI